MPYSCQAVVDPLLGTSELTSPGVRRRARTSAAMIGLALSMGAASLLLPRQDDGAAAAESKVPGSTVTAALSGSQGFHQSESEVATAASTHVIEHVVRPGQTLQHIAERYQVSIWSIATTNDLAIDSTLRVGQVLKVPVADSPSSAGLASSISEVLSERASGTPVNRPPLVASATLNHLPEVQSSIGAENIAPIEQSSALDRLRQQRDKLRESLAELRYEEPSQLVSAKPESLVSEPEATSSTSAVATLPQQPLVESNASAGQPTTTHLNMVATTQSTEPDWLQTNQSLGVITPQQSSQAATVEVEQPSSVAHVTPSGSSIEGTGITQPIVPPSSGSGSSLTYRVEPGDTVARIARTYNIPQSLLIDANNLSDPNIIFVGQVLAVPGSIPAQTETVVASTSLSSVVPGPTQAVSAPRVPSSAEMQTSQGLGGSSEIPLQTIPISSSAETSQDVAVAPLSGGESNITPETELKIDPSEPSSGLNPYVSNLLSEIRALQQRNQPANLTTTGLMTDVEAANEASATLAAAAPSDSGERGSYAINPHLLRTPDRPEMATIPAQSPVQPSAAENTSDLVATRSLGSEDYAPLLQPITGRLVSPDLPPLPGADSFLPEDGGVLNGYIWPSRGILTSGYGWRWGRMHQGIDIAADIGTPIYAAATGVIEFAGWNSGGYGNMVEIRHADGSLTRYAHMNAIQASVGQRVTQGDQIGEMGSTGYSTGPHLHFEVHLPNQGTVNPMAYLPAN